MEPKALQAPQFITRDMFSFEFSTKFQLQVSVQTYNPAKLFLSGATKAGPFTYSFNPTGTGSPELFTFAIADIPIFVTLHVGTGVSGQGTDFAQLYLLANETKLFKLFSGYVYTNHDLSWPQVQDDPMAISRGYQSSLSSSNPAANTNLTLTVGTGDVWVPKSIRIPLTTDANVANRRVHLQFKDDAGGIMLEYFPSVDQAASTTYTYYFQAAPAPFDELDNNVVIVPIHDNIVLYEGCTIVTAIVNLQATDNLGSCEAYGEYFKMET